MGEDARVHLELDRDAARTFPELPEPDAVETGRIWQCKYRTFEPIAELRNLRALVIMSYPDTSLEPISGLSRLRYLRIIHLPRVRDLAALARLQSLTTLCLETAPGWDASGKRTVVASLEPIATLKRLEHIQLFSVVPPDRSLASLEVLPSLTTARLQGFPRNEIVRFFQATGVEDAFAPRPDY
jgi:hypothetical protein